MSSSFLLLCIGVVYCTDDPIVDLPFGRIQGFSVSRNTSLQQPLPRDVSVFMNIPYAKRPERFKPPQPLSSSDKWSGVRNCTYKSNSCVDSEDCLYLNIHAPSILGRSQVPVMVYIHGGSFLNGEGAKYNGTAIASVENVIVVTINYRLGAIGFMASAALQSDNDINTVGNWAMLDQQMALKWVQEHISNFGGDTNKVLIYGESAGAFSVAWHMAAAGGKGLFHAAISESGGDSEWIFQKKDDAFKFYDWVAQQGPGCKDANDLECLRKAPFHSFTLPASLRNDPLRSPTWASIAYPSCPYGPVIDGSVLSMLPSDAAKKGLQNDVPLIMGSNLNDGSIFAAGLVKSIHNYAIPFTEDDIALFSKYAFGANATAIEKFQSLYPFGRGGYEKAFDLISDSLRDAMFVCPSRRLSRAWNQVHSYTYQLVIPHLFPRFYDVFPIIPSRNSSESVVLSEIGTYHGSDVSFVFKWFHEEALNLTRIVDTVKHDSKLFSAIGSIARDLYMSNPARESFHSLSDTLSCTWAAMSSSSDPNSKEHSCGGSKARRVEWKSGVENYMRFHSNSKGDNEMAVLDASGSNKGHTLYLPSDEVCDYWNEHIGLGAFRDFRADL